MASPPTPQPDHRITVKLSDDTTVTLERRAGTGFFPHRLDLPGPGLVLVDDAEADAIAGVLKLANEALDLRSLGRMGEAS